MDARVACFCFVFCFCFVLRPPTRTSNPLSAYGMHLSMYNCSLSDPQRVKLGTATTTTTIHLMLVDFFHHKQLRLVFTKSAFRGRSTEDLNAKIALAEIVFSFSVTDLKSNDSIDDNRKKWNYTRWALSWSACLRRKGNIEGEEKEEEEGQTDRKIQRHERCTRTLFIRIRQNQ